MRRLAILFACAATALCAAAIARADGNGNGNGNDKTAEIMAAYVYNFAKFVEWPVSALPAPPVPIVLCTTDAEALDGHLVRIHGREAQGHLISVRILDAGEDIAGCQMLFLPKRDATRAPAYLAGRERQPILTISDAPDFAARGGIIGLLVETDRVHFAIERTAAVNAGLRISSRLLVLARVVPPRNVTGAAP